MSYAYDALERLQSITSSGANGVGTFTYNYVGNTAMLARLDLPNNTQTVQSYDSLQRLTQTVNQKNNGTNLNTFVYSYDTRDVRTAMQSQHGSDPLRQVSYGYDAVDQLKTEASSGGLAGTNYTNAFDYDGMGNRTRAENVSGGNTRVTNTTPNELNQISALTQSVNGAPAVTSGFGYDESGNTTEIKNPDSSKTLFSYDDADRLVRIEKRSAADAPLAKSEFVYDYASRKAVSKEFTYTAGAWVKTGEKRRVFDGLDVVQERNADNEVTAQLVRDGNIGGILSRSTLAGASFFGYDGGGNVTLLTDSNGDDVGRYRYDAFGNTLEASGARAAENPYRFSTKELHAASGLYDFGYRFYSPGLGRWINRDPIREDGGVNLYAMVGNDPVNAVDEYGLQTTYGSGHHMVPGATFRAIKYSNTPVWDVFNADHNRLYHDLYKTHNRRSYGGVKESWYRGAVEQKLIRFMNENNIGASNASIAQRLNSMSADQAQCFTNSIKRIKDGIIGKYNNAVKKEIALAITNYAKLQGAKKGWSLAKVGRVAVRLLKGASSAWSISEFMWVPDPYSVFNPKTGKWERPRGGFAKNQPPNADAVDSTSKLASTNLDNPKRRFVRAK